MLRSSVSWLGLVLLALPLATGPTRPSLSQVALDGSVNSDFSGPVPLDGRDYDVRAEFGHVEGRNLFHSFKRFDLDTGQRATFSAPDALRIGRVISRVTGGDRSDIDGTIRSDIAGADFYLINPAGVVFGRNAQLHVQGSFHVSTADELRFPEGKVFSATNPADSSFSVAAPDAFGFLDRAARAIRVDRSELDVAPDQALSLVGGNLVIDRGLIALRDFERNGNVTLVAMSRPGTVAVADGRPSAAPQGRILITDSEIDVSSFAGGGVVRIRAGALVVEASLIFANSGADEPGPATALIEIEAEFVRQDLAAIRSIAIGAGDAGDVRVKAGELAVLNRAELRSDTGGPGNAGNVTVSARELEIANGGLIASESFAAGDAGNVLVRADQVTIHTARPDFPTGITTSAVLETGNAGTVTVEAKELTVRDSGVISSNSLDRGDAGRVELSADHIAVLTGGQIGSGTGERRTEDGGFVRSTGAGGDVVVNARETILISGQSRFVNSRTGDFPPSGIFASTESTSPDAGNAGRATVTAPVITIADRGEIASESLNPADGGRLVVSAERLVIDAGEITTKAESSGDGGRIEVDAGLLELRNGGLITARSTGGGRAGTVTVDADAIELRSGAAISSSSRRGGAAGAVRIMADDRLLLLGGSEVSTEFRRSRAAAGSGCAWAMRSCCATASSPPPCKAVATPPPATSRSTRRSW